jgi:hypothetical protein
MLPAWLDPSQNLAIRLLARRHEHCYWQSFSFTFTIEFAQLLLFCHTLLTEAYT